MEDSASPDSECALGTSDESETTGRLHASVRSSKKAAVRSACTRRQRRKSKCSSDRPRCQYCSRNNRECIFKVAEGSTRTEDLKRKLEEALRKIEDLQLFFEALRSGTDSASTELYARLRIGEPVEVLLKMVQAGALPTWSPEELRAT